MHVRCFVQPKPDDAPSEKFTYGFEKNKKIVTGTFLPPAQEDSAETLLKFFEAIWFIKASVSAKSGG